MGVATADPSSGEHTPVPIPVQHRRRQRAGTGARASGGAVRRDIQGLRALAVLAVVADHAGVGVLAGGYVGVDVFFVVSGFLITSLLLREARSTGRISLGGFYARRARRILPAATVVLVATMAFTAAELSYARVQQVTTDAGWAAAFLANVRFSALGTDYFAEGLPPSPVQHFWSLAVEEQFYLVWPLLLAVLLLLGRRLHRAGGSVAPRAAALVAVACVASFVWSLHLVASDQTAAYFSAPGRAWELGVGALLALVAHRLERTLHVVRWVLGGAGLAAVLTAVLTYDASTRFPGWTALVPVLGTAAVIAAGVGTDAVGPARALTVWPMTPIGDVSYSWYLWHWPVIVLWEAHTPGRTGPLGVMLLVGVSLLLAVLSYQLVENPLRRQRWLAARRRRALVLWPVALALVLGSAAGARLVGEHRLAATFDRNEQYLTLRHERMPPQEQLRESLLQANVQAPVAFPLTSVGMLDALAKDLWNYRYRCNAAQDQSTVPLCPVGDRTSSHVVVVVGDSHIGQWLPALDRIGRRTGYRVVPLIKYGCTPYAVDLQVGGRPYTECQDFRDWAIGQIAALHPDVVVVGGRGLQGNMTASLADRGAVWTSGVSTTLGRLAPLTQRLIVVGDVPALAVDPLGCLTDTHATMATCTTPVDPRTTQANRLTAAAARRGGATYVDLSDLACLDGRCPAVAGGRMVYANDDHLSITWVQHVTPEVSRRLDLRPPA